MPFGAAHTYIAYIREYPPPPPPGTQSLHICEVFNGTSVLLIMTTTVLTNKRHTESRSICTENFDNRLIENKY